MKVLHVITRLDPGGSAENTLLSCQHLADKGWEVVLAAGPGKTEDLCWIESSGVRAVVIPSLRRDPHPTADPRALWQLLRLIRRERPDILHTHSAKGGILGRWAGWLARVPHIVHTPHGHVLYGYARGFKNWLYLLAERITAPITDRLVALSEGERRESVEHGIGRADQWVVIPSGVPIEEIVREPVGGERSNSESESGSGILRVGTVARLEHVKGVDILILAAARLATNPSISGAPFEVLIWGDGDQEEELLRLAEDSGVEKKARLVGTAQDVDEFLAGLDIYVQPSRNEGMGRALVLAQAHGLPVVATRVCGIPDVVRDDVSGILVESENPAALEAGLERLTVDSSLRNRLAKGAEEWILETDESGFPRFSVEAMAWWLERLYEQLIDNRR